jgi:hypothetical protein
MHVTQRRHLVVRPKLVSGGFKKRGDRADLTAERRNPRQNLPENVANFRQRWLLERVQRRRFRFRRLRRRVAGRPQGPQIRPDEDVTLRQDPGLQARFYFENCLTANFIWSLTVGSEVAPVQNPQDKVANVDVHKPPKRRGGWPKGRKRKPELMNLPPKAPATGYNLYLNEQRKLFKDSNLVFHEITKVIGNKWSNLSLEEKRPYLAKAEEDKRRYREELKQYRQSDAYRAYLAKKRRNRLQNNVLSESDMDATDEIDVSRVGS